MKKTFYLIAGLFTLAMTSCGGGSSEDDSYFDELFESSYDITLDNGLDTTAIVMITEEGSDSTMEFQVDGYGIHEIELKEAKYHITAKTVTDSSFLDADFEIDGSSYSYNLNLSQQDYIVERVVYVVSENPELYMTNKSFTYDGKTYDEVDAYVIPGALLVPSEWDYNLEEEMPEEVTIYGDQNTTTKTKVYRAETFVLYLELYELFGDLDLGEE